MSASIACIVTNKKKILIAHRLNKGDMGGRWEFPGGKLEEGEDCAAAIKREMKEEFEVEATPVCKITESHFLHKGVDCTLFVYEVTFDNDGVDIPYKLSEHSEYRWVGVEEIKKFNFVDSDLAVYDEVKKYLAVRCESA